MKRKRFLIIGAGSIGKRHARNLESLWHSVSFVESDIKIVSDLNNKTFNSLNNVDFEDFDAALVCTPTSMHASHARTCLEAGLPVFIEKPVSNTMDGIANLINLAEKKKLPVLVGCNLRFLPELSNLKKLIDSKRFGEIYSVNATFGYYLPSWRSKDYRLTYSAQKNQGGGIILDAIHELDYIRWLLSREPLTVKAITKNTGALDLDVEDNAEILLDFGPTIARIHLDYLNPEYSRKVELLTEKKKVVVSLNKAKTDNSSFIQQMRHFIDCIDGRRKPEQDLRQAAAVLKTALTAKGEFFEKF